MAREEIKIDRAAEQRRDRKTRVPLGVPRMKLKAEQAPGKVRRWVNDTVDRIHAAQEGGYEFVQRSAGVKAGDPGAVFREGLDSRMSKVVGTKEDGSPLHAYLMEIDADWHKEDQAAKQEQINETERALMRGSDEKGTPGRDGRYVPRDGISIERK